MSGGMGTRDLSGPSGLTTEAFIDYIAQMIETKGQPPIVVAEEGWVIEHTLTSRSLIFVHLLYLPHVVRFDLRSCVFSFHGSPTHCLCLLGPDAHADLSPHHCHPCPVVVWLFPSGSRRFHFSFCPVVAFARLLSLINR